MERPTNDTSNTPRGQSADPSEIGVSYDETEPPERRNIAIYTWGRKYFDQIGIHGAAERMLGICLGNDRSHAKTDMSRELSIKEQQFLFDAFDAKEVNVVLGVKLSKKIRSTASDDQNKALRHVENVNKIDLSQYPDYQIKKIVYQRRLVVDKNHTVRKQWIAEAIKEMKNKIINPKKAKAVEAMKTETKRISPDGDRKKPNPLWLRDENLDESPPTQTAFDDEQMEMWNFVDEHIRLVGHVLGHCKSGYSDEEESLGKSKTKTFFELFVKMGQASIIHCLYRTFLAFKYIFEIEFDKYSPEALRAATNDKGEVSLTVSFADLRRMIPPSQSSAFRLWSTSFSHQLGLTQQRTSFLSLDELETIRQLFVEHKCKILGSRQKVVTKEDLEFRVQKGFEFYEKIRNLSAEEFESLRRRELSLVDWKKEWITDKGIKKAAEEILEVRFGDKGSENAEAKEVSVREQKYLFDLFKATVAGVPVPSREMVTGGSNGADEPKDVNKYMYVVEDEKGDVREVGPEDVLRHWRKEREFRLQWIADGLNAMKRKMRTRRAFEIENGTLKKNVWPPHWLESEVDETPPKDDLESLRQNYELVMKWKLVDEHIYLVGHILGHCRNGKSDDVFHDMFMNTKQPSAFLALHHILVLFKYVFESDYRSYNEETGDEEESFQGEAAAEQQRLKKMSEEEAWKMVSESLPPRSSFPTGKGKGDLELVTLDRLEGIRQAFLSHKCDILDERAKTISQEDLAYRVKTGQEFDEMLKKRSSNR